MTIDTLARAMRTAQDQGPPVKRATLVVFSGMTRARAGATVPAVRRANPLAATA